MWRKCETFVSLFTLLLQLSSLTTLSTIKTTTSMIKRRISSLLTALLILPLSVNASSNDKPFSNVEQELEQLRKKYDAPGMAVAVVKDNKIVYTQGFGYRDLAKKLPVNDDTVFSIGSIAKSFTGAMTGVLAEQNKLSLQDSPIKHLPYLSFNTELMNQQVKIKDLLRHGSGLGNLDGSIVLFPETDKSLIAKRLKYLQPEGAVNDSWIYSNVSYALTGAVMEAASGLSWQALLQSSLLTPLKMDSTYSSVAALSDVQNLSLGYGKTSKGMIEVPFEQFHANEPGGAISSNVKDMSHWMMAWLNKGKFNDVQVIPSNYVESATQIQNITPQGGADAEVYLFGVGYGWKVNSHKGHYKVHHGGNTSGFSAQLVMFPNSNLGIIALTNQTLSVLPYLAVDILTNHMLELPKTPVESYPVVITDVYELEDKLPDIQASKLPNGNLASYAGSYSAKGYGTVKIENTGNNLTIKFPVHEFGLKHQKDNIFEMMAVENFPRFFDPRYHLSFDANDEGDIESFRIYLQSYPITFTKES